jgi:hypothetical protein
MRYLSIQILTEKMRTMDECEHVFVKAYSNFYNDLYDNEVIVYCAKCGLIEDVITTHREDENNGNS